MFEKYWLQESKDMEGGNSACGGVDLQAHIFKKISSDLFIKFYLFLRSGLAMQPKLA
jgi:hypothetical protein